MLIRNLLRRLCVLFALSVTRWWSFPGVLCGTSLMRRPTTVRCSSTAGAWVSFWIVYRWVHTHPCCTCCVFSETIRIHLAAFWICSIHVRNMLIDYKSCNKVPLIPLYDLTLGVSRQTGASPQHVGAFGKCCWGQSTEATVAHPTVHHCIQVREQLKQVESTMILEGFWSTFPLYTH